MTAMSIDNLRCVDRVGVPPAGLERVTDTRGCLSIRVGAQCQKLGLELSLVI